MYQGQGGCSQSCCSSAPTGASEPSYERDAWCQLLTKWLKVSAVAYVSDLSNVTPRDLGSEQKGRVSFLRLTLSSGLASLLLRWKTADTVFVVLSFSFQVWRYSVTVAMSLHSTPSTACRSHQHAWLLGRQHMHTFWRRCLASQRCRCWREGVPGQLLVGRRSWGVTPLGWCEITTKFVSACFTSCQIYLLVKNSFDKLDPMSKRSSYKSKQSCFNIAHTSCRTCLLQLLVTDNSFQSNIVKVAERSVSNRVFPNPKPVFFGYFQLPETRVFKKTGIAVAFKY